MSYLLAFVLCGALGIVGLVLVNYINQKRNAKLVKATPPEQTSLPTTLAPSPKPQAQTPKDLPISNERITIDVTPEYLVSFFNNHTAVQANKLAEAYIGKWMKTSGTVQDVESQPGHILVLFRPSQHGPLVYAPFREQRWTDRVMTLKLGDNLTVFGQIRNVDRLTLFMDKCEIVDSHSKDLLEQ